MYIVAIAWLYVTLLMALTEPSVVGGMLTFVFYGVLPCALLLWVIGTPQRKRNKALTQKTLAQISEQPLGEPDRSDAKPD